MSDSTTEVINKARCHPIMQEKVVPRVEFLWNMFPFTLVLGQIGPLINLCLFPCFWWIYIPFQLFVVDPWNAGWAILLLSPFYLLFVVILGPFILFSLIVSTCVSCCVVINGSSSTEST